MPAPRIALALLAATALLDSSRVAAQTTSARSDSLEVAGRADSRREAGDHERAADLYRRAISLDDQNERAYLGLSASLDALGRHREALALLGDAESRLGWTPELAVQRGIHLSRLDRWDAAATALRRVLERRPRSYDAAYYLAAAELHRRDWAAAVAAIDGYLASRPQRLATRDPEIRTRRAFALLHAGKLERARRDLEASLAARDSRAARVLLVTALAKQGRCRRALALAAQIEGAAAETPTLIYDTAVCRFRTGDPRGALALLDDAPWPDPPPQVHLLSAEIHASLGDRRRARAGFRRAIAAGLPVEARFARWLLAIGASDDALELLWPRVERGSTDPELLALAATAARNSGALDRADRAAGRLVELRPDPASYLLRGEILLAKGDLPGADASFSAALAGDPGSRPAAVGLRRATARLATAAVRAGDRERARALLERGHRADPDDAATAFNLALLELDRGRPARAIELVEPRIDAIAPAARGQLLLCRAYLAGGDRERAIAALERALDDRAAPADLRTRALSDLAQLVARSAPRRALELIDRARKLAPANTAALLNRAEAEARLALAVRSYERGELTALRRHLSAVRVDALSASARDRYALLEPFAIGARKGLAEAMRTVAALSDDQLAALGARELSPAALRHALALQVGQSLLRRARDYRRYLRAHVRGLRKAGRDSATAARIATAWFDSAMSWAIANRAATLARDLARDAPRDWQSDAFRHNAIIAGGGKLTRGQIARLDALAGSIPEALINLATDAERRGDDAAALRYLNRIPRARRTPAIADWLRWKELFHGAR
jgi:tetratricopeptide (TPR) repeat protein